jgi:hypothetical protein
MKGKKLKPDRLKGYHAALSDCMILLMTFVLVLEHSRFAPLRGTVAFAITPPVFFCLMEGRPWNAVVPVALMITMGLAAINPDLRSDTAGAANVARDLGGRQLIS